ncbi:MAG TPA: hypothetical protein VL309_10670 [Vicinamibacterales bacterium]|nr:hypothetical protein [Vicinamibacterales bacterium]
MDVESRQSIDRLRDEIRADLAALRDDLRLIVQRLVVLSAKLDSRHK